MVMEKLRLLRKKSKQGVASLYVVLFSTILFGVITLSFMRIVLSEAGQSSDDDLSQSAYDSALAGVEDAKRAVNDYYGCLSRGGSAASCNAAALFDNDCTDGIGLAQYLYGNYSTPDEGWEVKIQETAVGSAAADNNSDQAYTCVVISDRVPDYRGTLTTDTRTRVIPLSVYDGERTTNTNTAQVAKIRFQWYSRLNEGTTSNFNLSAGGKFRDQDTLPPTIQLSFIHLPENLGTIDFNSANNNNGYHYSTLLLVPAAQNNTSSAATTVTWNTLDNVSNVTNGVQNTPVEVTCTSTADFACTVDLEIGTNRLGNRDSVFLVASMPYGDAVMDFAAEMLDAGGNTVQLVGSQISVDSTGRTAQLVRRVETRLDPADLYFPYPQYALELDDGGGDALRKSFWITANCWYSNKLTGNYAGGTCDNNGELHGTGY